MNISNRRPTVATAQVCRIDESGGYMDYVANTYAPAASDLRTGQQNPSKLDQVGKTILALRSEIETLERVVCDLCGTDSICNPNCEVAKPAPPPSLATVLSSLPDVMMAFRDRVAQASKVMRERLL